MRRLGLLVVLLGAATAQGEQPAASVLGSSAVTWDEIQGRSEKSPRQVFRAPTATLDELEMHVSTLPPGQSPHPPHKHPDEELVIIKEGTVEAMVGGQTRRVGPGSVIFQASNQMHGMKNVGDVPAVYHVIRWNSPGMLAKKPN